MTRYLELEDLLRLCDDIGVGPVRDLGLLGAALARPQTTVMGADAYPTLEAKAAALLHSLVCNHALVDGNKRIAWHATVVFVGFNGFRLTMTQTQAINLVMAVASGELRDVEDIAARLSTKPR
jgi:death on curing protein